MPDGDQVIPALNRAIEYFRSRRWPIYASRDWHPADSRHFRAFGGRWPAHCVAGTPGAAFHADLQLPADTIIISKGRDQTDDGYSAFGGAIGHGEGLVDDLNQRRIAHLYVGGLATEYCVLASVIDARNAGFPVTVLVDAVTGIGRDDMRRAFEDMRAAGAVLAQSDELDSPAESHRNTSTD